METLTKRWTNNIAASKKFLSRHITHSLSHLLDRKKFDVVYEGNIKAGDENEPDVIVYDKANLSPLMAIEVCEHEEVGQFIHTAQNLMESSGLKEFFIYDRDQNSWTNLHRESKSFVISSSSIFKGVSLEGCLGNE